MNVILWMCTSIRVHPKFDEDTLPFTLEGSYPGVASPASAVCTHTQQMCYLSSNIHLMIVVIFFE